MITVVAICAGVGVYVVFEAVAWYFRAKMGRLD